LARRARRWNGQAILFQALDMKFDGFADQSQDLVAALADCQTPRQIRDMCAPTRFTVLDDHHVAHHRHLYFSLFSPACFSMSFKVPGGISRLGWPATVTMPGLVACLYCRWLPRVRASRQPSFSRSRINSPTFTRVSWPLPCNF